MTEAEQALMNAVENLALAVSAKLPTDYVIYTLHMICKKHYPDSLLAHGLPFSDADMRRLKCRLTDPVAYDQLYT